MVWHRLSCTMKFSCFTFSLNQIQLLTHQTDPYFHKEHLSKKWLKSHNRYLKSLQNSCCCCCSISTSVSQKPGDETLHKDCNPWQVVQENFQFVCVHSGTPLNGHPSTTYTALFSGPVHNPSRTDTPLLRITDSKTNPKCLSTYKKTPHNGKFAAPPASEYYNSRRMHEKTCL